MINPQLLDCCDQQLSDDLIKAMPEFSTAIEVELLDGIKELAVIPVAIGVRRAELINMRQDSEENVRSFHDKVKEIARNAMASSCNKAAVSHFKKEQKTEIEVDLKKTSKCASCTKLVPLVKKMKNGIYVFNVKQYSLQKGVFNIM